MCFIPVSFFPIFRTGIVANDVLRNILILTCSHILLIFIPERRSHRHGRCAMFVDLIRTFMASTLVARMERHGPRLVSSQRPLKGAPLLSFLLPTSIERPRSLRPVQINTEIALYRNTCVRSILYLRRFLFFYFLEYHRNKLHGQ